MTWLRMPQVALPEDQLPLVLVGLPGAGKTTVARLLAQVLGVQVTDTDAEIRRRARMTIPEIFATEGEAGFREREYRALYAVLESPAPAQGVIALGGGAVLRPENRALLEGHTVVHLSALPETAAAHVGNGQGRPLIGPEADSDQAKAAQDGSTGRKSTSVLERMQALHTKRMPLYTEVASLTVPTDGLSPQQVAALILVALGVELPATTRALAVLELPSQGRTHGKTKRPDADASAIGAPACQAPDWQSDARGLRRIRVGGAKPYEVVIGHGLAAQLVQAVVAAPGGGAGAVALIHAEVMSPVAAAYQERLVAAGLRVGLIGVPDGEAAKTPAVLERVWHELGALRLGRDGLIIGIGGGATTDLAGFAAATWLRGVPVIQVPTTLLALVDAAVGGKTGINSPAGKNLVGAFHPPSAVIADLDTLATLDRAELRAGLAEVVKCGFIADPVILDLVLSDPADALVWDSPVLAELIARSVAVKAQVVGQDLTEGGLREILNYGHTYAHAIEKATDFSWRHGEAVAVGCVFAAEVASRCGRLSSDVVALHRQAFKALGLPVEFPAGRGRWEQMRALMLSDKKVRAGALRMVLLDAVGTPVRTSAPTDAVLQEAHRAVTGPGEG